MSDRPSHVEVLPGGRFAWGDDVYDNGNRLLKAIYNKDKHRMTIRRYFGLTNIDSDYVQALTWEFRKSLATRTLVVTNGRRITVRGDLSDIPAQYRLSDDGDSLRLEPDEVVAIMLEREANSGSA